MNKGITGVYSNLWGFGKNFANAGVCLAYLIKDYPERTKELMNVKVNGKSISDYFDTPEKMMDFIDIVVNASDFIEEQIENEN